MEEKMIQSVSGTIWHDLYYLYMSIAIAVGALVIGWLVYSMVKFRRRPGDERPRDAPKAGVLPAERGHPIWSYVMALVIGGIMFGLAFGTISAVHTEENPPAPSEGPRMDVNVTGFQFGWRLTEYGAGGIPVARVADQSSPNTYWHIPVNTAIVADVKSQDVWHNFALPQFRIRIDVIPGQTNHIWWEAQETGTIDPVCVQLCGPGHALMKSRMVIDSQADFAVWFANQTAQEYAKLAKNGQMKNGTYDGTTLVLSGDVKDPAKAWAAHVTNAGPSDVTIHAAQNEITIKPGSSGDLYVPAGATPSVGGVGK